MTGSAPPIISDFATTHFTSAPRPCLLCSPSLVTNELRASLCARALRARYLANPHDIAPIRIKPLHAFRDVKVVDRNMKLVAKQLVNRAAGGEAHLLRKRAGTAAQAPQFALLARYR